MTVVRFVASLFLGAVLAGCSGGGGGSGGGGSGGDVQAPTVEALAPADGAQPVALDAVVTALLNEPVDAASVTAGSLSVSQGGAPVPGTTILLGDGRTLQFTPAAALARHALYEATLAGSVTDAAGNTLGADVSWSFTTGRFSPAAPIAGGESSGLSARAAPNLVVGPDGSATYAYKDLAVGHQGIYVYRDETAGGWTEDLQLPGATLGFPALGIDGAGGIWLVYVQFDPGTGFDLIARRRDPLLGWQAPGAIVSIVSTPNSIVQFDLVVASGGRAAVLWHELTGSGNDGRLRSAIYDGTGWSAPALLPNYSDENAQSHKWPFGGRIAFDEATGVAVARWAEVDHNCCSFFGWYDVLARYTPGVGWDAFARAPGSEPIGQALPDHAPALELLPGATTALSVRMSYRSDDGQAHPVGLGALYDVASNAIINGPYLDDYVSGSNDPAIPENAYNPRSAMDASGNVLLLWNTNDNRQPLNAGVTSRVYTPGDGYGPLEAVAPPMKGSISWPVLAGAPDGTAAAAWLLWDGSAYNIYATYRAPGQPWEPVQRLASMPADISGLAIDINASGGGVVTWEEEERATPGSADYAIRASRFE